MTKAKRQELGKMFDTVSADKTTAPTEKRPDRVGKRATLFQLPAAAKKQLAILAVEHDTTQQALFSEALTDLITKN